MGTVFDKFVIPDDWETVDEDRQREGDKKLVAMEAEMRERAVEYFEKMRRAKAKSYQWSLTRVIG